MSAYSCEIPDACSTVTLNVKVEPILRWSGSSSSMMAEYRSSFGGHFSLSFFSAPWDSEFIVKKSWLIIGIQVVDM